MSLNLWGNSFGGASGFTHQNNVKIDLSLTTTTPPIPPNRKKRKSRSWVWEYFTLLQSDSIDGNVGFVQCNLCDHNGQSSQGRYKYSGGTSNMSLHLSRKHQLREEIMNLSSQPGTPMSSSNPSQSSTPRHSTTPPRMIDSNTKRRLLKGKIKSGILFQDDILRLLIEEGLPLRILDSSIFQNLLHGIIPTRNSALETLEEKYRSCCDTISKHLSDEIMHVTLSIEETIVSNQSTVGITLHWVDRHFNVYRVLVHIEAFPRNLQMSQMMTLLSRLYRLFPILQGQVKVIVVSTKSLYSALHSIAAVSTEQFVVVMSLVHTINDCVEAGLSKISTLLDKVAAFADVLCFNEDKHVQDTTQRNMPWKETIRMLQKTAALKMDSNDDSVISFTSEETKQINSLLALLTPFTTAETLLSIDATYGLVVPVLENLRGFIVKHKGSVGEVQKSLLDALNDTIKNHDDLGTMTAMLDPRFKHMPFLSTSAKEKAQIALYQAYEAIPKSIDDLNEKRNEFNQTINDEQSGQVAKAMASFFGLTNQKKKKNEIEIYFDFPSLPFDITSNPIEWWKGNQSSFPHLSKLARDYFSIPASCPWFGPIDRMRTMEDNYLNCLKSISNYSILFNNQENKIEM